MKTISILILAAVLAVGAQQMGYVDFQPAIEKGRDFLQGAGFLEKEPRSVVVGLDITAGREGDLAKDREAIGKLVHSLRPGEKLDLYLIHSRAESEQEAVFTAELPEEAGAGGQRLARAKKAAETAWAECWDKKVMPLLSSNKTQRTELIGFMRFLSSQKPEFLEHKNPELVLLTDGQEVNGEGFNFEKRAPRTSDIERLRDNDLLPDLSGVRVVIAGMTPTHGISNVHSRKLHAFYKEFAKECGAKSVSITSERRAESW